MLRRLLVLLALLVLPALAQAQNGAFIQYVPSPNLLSAALGPELAPAITAPNWTCGAGWDCSVAGTLNKNAAGVGTATPNPAISIVAGTTYKVVITVGALTVANGAYYRLGGAVQYAGTYGAALSAAKTYTEYLTATANGSMTFEPIVSATRFTITQVSIKALTDATGDLTVEGNLIVGSPVTFNSPTFTTTSPVRFNLQNGADPASFTYFGVTGNVYPMFMLYSKNAATPSLDHPLLRVNTGGGFIISDYLYIAASAFLPSGELDQTMFGVGSDLSSTGVSMKASNNTSHHDLMALYDYVSDNAQGNLVGATRLRLDAAGGLSYGLVADAVVQLGQTVMPDAGTDGRFDVTTGSGTSSIGVFGGNRGTSAAKIANGPSVQGTEGLVIYGGMAFVAPAEDQAVTRGHYLIQSATAGYCNDSATITTIGLNIAKALYSEPVTNVIVFNGCTGAAGCINTAANTPNAGPAGQITLSADVAAAGWRVGEPVVYWNSGGASPTGLTDGATYWLVSVATTNVTIAATKDGAVIVPSSQGNDATQYLQRLPLAAVSIQ